MSDVKTVGRKTKSKSVVRIYRPVPGCGYSIDSPLAEHCCGISKEEFIKHPIAAQQTMREINKRAWAVVDQENPEILEVTPRYVPLAQTMAPSKAKRMAGKKKSDYEPRSVGFKGERVK